MNKHTQRTNIFVFVSSPPNASGKVFEMITHKIRGGVLIASTTSYSTSSDLDVIDQMTTSSSFVPSSGVYRKDSAEISQQVESHKRRKRDHQKGMNTHYLLKLTCFKFQSETHHVDVIVI